MTDVMLADVARFNDYSIGEPKTAATAVGPESRQRRARSRAGRSLSWQVSLRQIGCCAAQPLILQLQQSVSPTQLPQLGGFSAASAGFGALADVSLAQPLGSASRMYSEFGGDLLDRHPAVAVAGDPDDVVTELAGMTPGHNDIFQPAHRGLANSDAPIGAGDPVGSAE
jgi:hypothetical protein